MRSLRTYSARVDVLRDGATYTTLHHISDPVIECNENAEIKASMAAKFLADPTVNWLSDEIAPIQTIDGKDYPIGVYVVATATTEHDQNGVEIVTVEAYDRSLYLKQHKTDKILHLSAGTRYLDAIRQQLIEAGIGLCIVTETAAVLQTDREDWPIGTSSLEIINTLLGEINYRQIWFNASGVAVLEPINEVSVENIKHQYDQNARIKRSCKTETDTFSAPNYFVVVCSNPDLPEPMIAVAENDDPRSALSTFRRGRKIVQTKKVDNIGSQQDLETYAQSLKLQSMMASETVTLYTENEGGHGVGDIVALMHPDVEGLYRETSWSIVMKEGKTMIHQLRRSVLV